MKKKILSLIALAFVIAGFMASAEQLQPISQVEAGDEVAIDETVREPTKFIDPTVTAEEVYENARKILLNRGIIDEQTILYGGELDKINLIDTIELGHRSNEEDPNTWYPVYNLGFILIKENNNAVTYESWGAEFNGLTGESNYLKKIGETTFQNIKTKEQAIEALKREVNISEESIKEVMPFIYPKELIGDAGDVPIMWRVYFDSEMYEVLDTGEIEGPIFYGLNTTLNNTIDNGKSASKLNKEVSYDTVFWIALGIGLITAMVAIWLVGKKK